VGPRSNSGVIKRKILSLAGNRTPVDSNKTLMLLIGPAKYFSVQIKEEKMSGMCSTHEELKNECKILD
jgi:hypothetical protein